MAKRFKFRLEVVGRVRRQAEQAAQRAVARRLAEVQAVETRIAGLDAAEQALLNDARSAAAAGRPDVAMMGRMRHSLGRLRQHRAAGFQQRAALLEQLGRERAALAEAARQVKVIDQLRTKALAAYARELQRAENAEHDELAVQRYVHQRLRDGGEEPA